MQQRYFASIEELRQDITHFKSNMVAENRRLQATLAARGLSVADLQAHDGVGSNTQLETGEFAIRGKDSLDAPI